MEDIYTPKELNELLLNYTNDISNNFKNIKMTGDIVDCNMWKWAGMSFKLMNNKVSFDCK